MSSSMDGRPLWSSMWNQYPHTDTRNRVLPISVLSMILELLDPSDLVSLTISTDESRAILTSANYDYLWRGCLDRFRQKLKAQREGEDSDSREEGDSDSSEDENSDSSEEENPDSSEEENPDSSEEKTDSTIGEEDLDWSDVELPECPPGVPAWRYANMAFGDRCNYCDLPNAHCVNIFNIFTRICEPCFLNWVVPGKYILSNVLRKEEHFLFLSLPVVKVPDEFFETHRSASYYLPFLKQVISEYRSLPHEGRVGDCASKWQEDFKATMRRWSEAGDMLRDWVGEKERPRVHQVRAKNPQIMEMLEEEGWISHDYPTDSETWNWFVSRQDELSEQALVIIVGHLRPLLENRRAERQHLLQGTEREIPREKFIMKQYAMFKREALLSDPTSKRLLFPGPRKMFRIPELELLRSCDVSDVSPGWTSFLPRIKRSLIRGTEGARKEVRTWYELSSVMAAMAPETWRHMAKTGLNGVHIMELMSNATPPDMDNPRAVFSCQDCNYPLWLDTVHKHEHFAAQWRWNIDTDIKPLEAKTIPTFRFSDDGLPQGPGSLQYDPPLVQLVEQLLRSVEPLNFSLGELLGQGECFMCASCAQNDQKPIGFECLVMHYRITEHKRRDDKHPDPLFLILSPAEALTALEDFNNRLRSSGLDENRAREQMLYGIWRKDLRCEKCVYENKSSRASVALEQWQTWEEMAHHLHDRHGMMVKLPRNGNA